MTNKAPLRAGGEAFPAGVERTRERSGLHRRSAHSNDNFHG